MIPLVKKVFRTFIFYKIHEENWVIKQKFYTLKKNQFNIKNISLNLKRLYKNEFYDRFGQKGKIKSVEPFFASDPSKFIDSCVKTNILCQSTSIF